MAPFLSVVIPAYNEEKRLPQSLTAILDFLKRQSYESEIIVSDDGSRDRTAVLAVELLEGFPHQVLVTPQNRGKGHAVRQGMLAAAVQDAGEEIAAQQRPGEVAESPAVPLQANGKEQTRHFDK